MPTKKAGRPKKYGEETKPVTHKVPISKVPDFKTKAKRILKKYEKK